MELKEGKNKQLVFFISFFWVQFRSEPDKEEELFISQHTGMESDDDIRRVPDYGGGASTSNRGEHTAATWIGGSQTPSEVATGNTIQRKRGRTPADKEHKRLKR